MSPPLTSRSVLVAPHLCRRRSCVSTHRAFDHLWEHYCFAISLHSLRVLYSCNSAEAQSVHARNSVIPTLASAFARHALIWRALVAEPLHTIESKGGRDFMPHPSSYPRSPVSYYTHSPMKPGQASPFGWTPRSSIDILEPVARGPSPNMGDLWGHDS